MLFLCLLLVVKKCKSQTRKEKKRRTTMKAPPSDEKLTNLLISFVWENPRCWQEGEEELGCFLISGCVTKATPGFILCLSSSSVYLLLFRFSVFRFLGCAWLDLHLIFKWLAAFCGALVSETPPPKSPSTWSWKRSWAGWPRRVR